MEMNVWDGLSCSWAVLWWANCKHEVVEEVLANLTCDGEAIATVSLLDHSPDEFHRFHE